MKTFRNETGVKARESTQNSGIWKRVIDHEGMRSMDVSNELLARLPMDSAQTAMRKT